MVFLLFLFCAPLRLRRRAGLGCLVADLPDLATSRSAIGMPESASNSAGTCAAISVMSPVILCIPVEPPLPVETIVILSTFASGAASARDDLRHAA